MGIPVYRHALMVMFLLGLSSLAAGQCADNCGKEFVLGFIENGRKMQSNLYISTCKAGNVNVEVTSPKWNNPFLHEQFSIKAGEVKTIDIEYNLAMQGTALSTKGILVKASDEVTVYGVNTAAKSTDAFLGLPTDVLGTEYFAVTYYPSRHSTEFLIAATKDSTKITVRLTSITEAKDVVYNGTTYKPGDTITLVMNRYDTFQVQSAGDLTGSYVTSDKPISFFSGNLVTSVGITGPRGFLVEQLLPVYTWGNRFATMPAPLELGDYFRVVAGCSETRLTYTCKHNGSTSTTTLMFTNAGDFFQVYIGAGMYCYWESDDPVLLVQFSSSGMYNKIGIDATMVMIPSIEQYSADYIFTTPEASTGKNFQSFFIFIAKTQEVQGLMVDNTRITFTHNTVPKTDLSIGYFDVLPGVHSVRQTSSTSVFGGFLYGGTTSESYGFPLGLRLPEPDVTGVCSSRYPCHKTFGFFEQVRQNINIKSGAIWEERGIKSLTTCGSLCTRDCMCASYSYHKGRKICRGHDRYTCTSLDQNDNTAEEGWGFWTNK